MITLKLEITETTSGINIELKADEATPSPREKLFARQMADTIAKFLNSAPKAIETTNEKN